MKTKGVIKDFKKLKTDNSKSISRNFSGAVVGNVGSVWFQTIPCSSLGPLQCMVNVNDRIFIRALVTSTAVPFLLCLQVSSVSNFHPDTRRQRWSLIQAHLFSFVVGREGCCKQRKLPYIGSACTVWTTLGLPQLEAVCAFWVYTAQAPGYSARALSEVGLVFRTLPRSKPLRFSGTLQGHRPGWACVLCPSQVRAAQETKCLSQVSHAS